jgi:hypothetical protein
MNVGPLLNTATWCRSNGIVFFIIQQLHSISGFTKDTNIKVIQGFMTNEPARKFASHSWQDTILFISDVRIGPPSQRETDQAQQDRIHEDMLSQQSWHEILQPLFSILKFCLPWNGNNFSYLNSTIHVLVYG